MAEEINPEILSMIKIVLELTKSDTLIWSRNYFGALTTKMGPFDVYVDVREPYSVEKPYFNLHSFDGCNGYNFSFILPEVAVLRQMAVEQITRIESEKYF